MRRWAILSLCLVGLLVAAMVVHTSAQDLRTRAAARRPDVVRPTVGRFQCHMYMHNGTLRHVAFDTATGQLYFLISRSIGIPGRVEWSWETLDRPVVGQTSQGPPA